MFTMASLRPSGQVQTSEQIRAERFRKGQCETCLVEPVQCYEIKRRIGGFIRERVPLTETGKVYNGICLGCHPDKDPRTMIRRARTDDGRRGEGRRTRYHRHHREDHERHHRHYPQAQDAQDQGVAGRFDHRGNRQQLPYNMDGDRGNGLERTNSAPHGKMERRPTRQQGYIDISKSLQEGDEKERVSQSLPAHFQDTSAANLDIEDIYEQEDEEPGYVEEITYNIFNEPVIVRKPKHRSRSNRHLRPDANIAAPSSPYQSGRGRNGASPDNSPRRPSHGHHTMSPPPYEEKVEEEPPENFDYPKPPPETFGGDGYGNGSSFRRQDSGPRPSPDRQHSSRRDNFEDTKKPSVPDLAPSDVDAQSKSSGDNDSLDFLARLVAQHVAKNPDEPVKFVPGSKAIAPNAELQLDQMDDEISVLTKETYWQGRETFATMATRQKSRKTNLSAISEASSAASSDRQPSMASHRIVEPAVPTQAGPTHDMESYLESSAPHLLTLRELVGQCTQAGADEEAINVVTQALVHDNATSMSQDLALFCLTTLWVLARKNDENKRKIIFEDVTFEVIIEAMRIYLDSSAVIQTRACGVLWSLSMASNDRKHVAQGGGCESILNAMLAHSEDDALQVMAMGALKVLSFDNIGKSMLRAFGALPIVSEIMQKHMKNPSIQSEGCVILGNLAVDEANQKVMPVSEKEVEAVIMGMIAHPESLEVHEAACFTLMSLASSSANVELIQSNSMSNEALQLAFQKHPDDVGINILTLLRRLKFDAPGMKEGNIPFNGS